MSWPPRFLPLAAALAPRPTPAQRPPTATAKALPQRPLRCAPRTLHTVAPRMRRPPSRRAEQAIRLGALTGWNGSPARAGQGSLRWAQSDEPRPEPHAPATAIPPPSPLPYFPSSPPRTGPKSRAKTVTVRDSASSLCAVCALFVRCLCAVCALFSAAGGTSAAGRPGTGRQRRYRPARKPRKKLRWFRPGQRIKHEREAGWRSSASNRGISCARVYRWRGHPRTCSR